jgi:hypothetical protein
MPSLTGIIITYLRQIFKVLIIGFRRYPMLAAVYLDTPLSLICGTLYIWLDFIMTILQMGLCKNELYASDENIGGGGSMFLGDLLKYYGTDSTLIFLQLLTDVPRYLFLSYISIKLPSLLIKRLLNRNRTEMRLTREQRILLQASSVNSVESKYVRNLFAKKKNSESVHPLIRCVRFVYHWRDDFRFSTRVVCVYAAISLLIFFFTVKVSRIHR